MNLIKESEYVSYQLLDNGIHQIELKDSTHVAADEYMTVLDNIIAQAIDSDEPIVRIMIMITAKRMPSLQYLSSGAKNVLAKYPTRPPFRNAYLFGKGVMAHLLEMFVKMVVQRNKDAMSFFPTHKEDEAIEWLLQN